MYNCYIQNNKYNNAVWWYRRTNLIFIIYINFVFLNVWMHGVIVCVD